MVEEKSTLGSFFKKFGGGPERINLSQCFIKAWEGVYVYNI